jgi:hypothetical protein
VVERLQHHRHQDMNTSYSDFLTTHPPIFSVAKDLLEAHDLLHTTESKFGLLHCIENQKTLYATQQIIGPAGGLVGILHRSTARRSPCTVG